MKSGLKFRPRILLSLFFVALALYAIIVAAQWPAHTRLFPQMAAGGLLIFAVWQIAKDVFGPLGPGARIMDFQFGEDAPPDVGRRMTIIWAWLVGFPLAIWLIGFAIAIPALTFAYLKFQGREGWAMSIGLAAGAFLFYWGLFVQFLHIPVPDPFLFRLFS